MEKKSKVNVNKNNLPDFLGVKKFKYGEVEAQDRIGIVTGLAWTEFGGEILKIETVNMPGKGRMQITGKLGDVMQESVKAAKSFVRSKSLIMELYHLFLKKKIFISMFQKAQHLKTVLQQVLLWLRQLFHQLQKIQLIKILP